VTVKPKDSKFKVHQFTCFPCYQESLLRNLEQSIEKAETEWGAKLHEKEEELEAVKSSISQGNTAHLEAELELQREANAKLLQRTKDLEEKLSSSQKEDVMSHSPYS